MDGDLDGIDGEFRLQTRCDHLGKSFDEIEGTALDQFLDSERDLSIVDRRFEKVSLSINSLTRSETFP